jgi:hypothetical protein
VSGPKWENDRIKRVRADWAAGLSIATIARRLGTTKSAIAGKATRQPPVALRQPVLCSRSG